MAMQSTTQSTVVVPAEIRKKHGALIDLILGSESMNDEERQYWINILPVMTPEQVENLRQILQNERDQLAAIDAKYTSEIQKTGSAASLEEMGRKRREKRAALRAPEAAAEVEEKRQEEELLRRITEGGADQGSS